MASPTPCSFPGRVITIFDRRLYVHEGLIGDLRWIENEWRRRGGHAAYEVRSIGAYNCRKTTSGSRWSEHSRGWAVDVNPRENPYGSHLHTDMPKWWVDLWKARGFGWGGDWNSVKDAMHFSKAPREGGDGILYRPSGIEETPTPPPPEPEPEPQPEPKPKEDEEDDMAVNSNRVGPVGPGTYTLGIITAHNEVWQGYKLHSVLEVVGLSNDADAEVLLVPHNSPLTDADTVVSAKGAEANINTPKQHGVALLVVKNGLASGELREIFVPNK